MLHSEAIDSKMFINIQIDFDSEQQEEGIQRKQCQQSQPLPESLSIKLKINNCEAELEKMGKILMICLGNICRSPIAEAVMQDTIQKAGLSWEVDSAAIGNWHAGNAPDHRAIKIMKNHGLSYTNRARQITSKDFQDFDYIFGMDEENMDDLKRLAPQSHKSELLMLGDFGCKPSDKIIEDPYYQRGDAGFEKAYQQCVIACDAFVKEKLIKE